MSEYIDFTALRFEIQTVSDCLWDEQIPHGANMRNLFDRYFSLPHHHLQIPLLAAYWSLPSTLCQVVPILFLDGAEGSGKSNISKVFARTFDINPYSVASTYASLRNDIDSFRWTMVEHPDGYNVKQEKNFCLVFDNLNRETLFNENLLTLFLCGYDRTTANISIAVEVGKNRQFNTFCPKVVSSVHNLLDEFRFRELKRRSLRIVTKKANDLTPDDNPNRIGLPDFDISDVDLGFLEIEHYEFWHDINNIMRFKSFKKEVRRYSMNVAANRKTLYNDLIPAALCTGVWGCVKDAISVVEEYESTLLALAATKTSLRIVFEELVKVAQESRTILPSTVRSYLTTAIAECLLEGMPSAKAIEEEMFNLGWKRAKTTGGNWCWKK